jgi:hypothetical protein
MLREAGTSRALLGWKGKRQGGSEAPEAPPSRLHDAQLTWEMENHVIGFMCVVVGGCTCSYSKKPVATNKKTKH